MSKLPTESRTHYRKLVVDFKAVSEHMTEGDLLETAETFGNLLIIAFDELDEVEKLLVAARDTMRCKLSGNPCNTDTRIIGAPPCCQNCRIHHKILKHFRQ